MAGNLYSQTPASNDMANYFQTNMLPSKVKIAGWDIMADIATWFGLPTSGGSANAQTITNTNQYTALAAGLVTGIFIPGFTNTGAMTLAIDGLTAKNVNCNGVAALAGMVVQNVPCEYVYDGTQYNILNPQRGTGSYTGTLNVGNTNTGTVNYAIVNDGKTAKQWFESAITATSSVTTLTLGGVPSILQTSAGTVRITCPLRNAAALVYGWFNATNTATWVGGFGTNAGGFTNASSNGIQPGTMDYSLDM